MVATLIGPTHWPNTLPINNKTGVAVKYIAGGVVCFISLGNKYENRSTKY
jgi:hypothetical protein